MFLEDFKEETDGKITFVFVTFAIFGLAAIISMIIAKMCCSFVSGWLVFCLLCPVLAMIFNGILGCIVASDAKDNPKEAFLTIAIFTFFPISWMYVVYSIFVPLVNILRVAAKGAVEFLDTLNKKAK